MVTMLPIVVKGLGTVSKDLVKWLEELKIGGHAETDQIRLRSP